MSRPGPRGDKSGCGALRRLRAEPSPDPQHQPPPPARTMSRPGSFAPGSPLLLLLLLACAALCQDAPMAGKLRCQCVQTHASVIHPRHIANVELIPERPHCGVPEVIATLKDGREVCLDPTARWVQMITTKILNSKIPVDQPALTDTVIPMDRK
nr:interleukin-8-like isoform X2 [Chrysemys picta bellii]